MAKYSVTTTAAATVTVQFGPTTSYGLTTSPQTTPAGGGTVNFLVAGMKQNTMYHMRAMVSSAGRNIFDGDHAFQTGAIPPQLVPSMQVTIPQGQQPTAGIRLLSIASESLAVNNTGDIIWYYQFNAGESPFLVKLLPNGHMILLINIPGPPTSSVLREVDLEGNTVRELTQTDLAQKLHNAGFNIDLLSIDHDVLVLPNGHWLFIATDDRVFHDLPGYPGDTTVIGSAVVDVDQNNTPVWVWDAFDHLDVNRHPMQFPDWTHANSLFYIPDDGSFLISLRHQYWVLKIDYNNGAGAGDVIWKLGYQGDFTLQNSTSPADWFYAQHDANIASSNLTGSFQLAVWDNGNNRVLDDGGDTCHPNGSPACYSTGALFDVDEHAMTASRHFSYQTPFSFWGGSTQLLGNSNVLVSETAPSDLHGSRAVEVTQQVNPVVVWKIEIQNEAAYRTKLLPSLYPNVQW